MLTITEDEIGAALKRMDQAVDRYRWIQEHIRSCDVSSSKTFQRSFNGFYRVRRDEQWQQSFYSLMQAAKEKGIGFGDALEALWRQTGRIEASFVSKLVATLDPSTPVIDSIVLSHFRLRLPYCNAANRRAGVLEVYRNICAGYAELLGSPTGLMIQGHFDQHFRLTGFTPLKKVDLVLWQIRPSESVTASGTAKRARHYPAL